jgi:hypothetical protein
VFKFKSCALKRHEKFNGLTKNFDCLSGRFRHIVDRFKNCFEAACVIAHCQVGNNRPLHDVLIDDGITMEDQFLSLIELQQCKLHQ